MAVWLAALGAALAISCAAHAQGGVEKWLGNQHPQLAATLAELGALRAAENDIASGVSLFHRARQIMGKAQAGAGTGMLRSMLVCPKSPLEELKGDL